MSKQYIVVHHSATLDGVVYRDFDAIKRGHMAKGWRDIGYHWVVEKVNGVLTAIPGRAEYDVGAHCIARNVDSIGICCIGNFEIEVPGEELYILVANLCREIMSRHPIVEIAGHKDYDATACPGRYFDIQIVKQLIKGGTSMQEVKVIVKNQEINGRLIDGVTYVPLRELVELLNNKVSWDEENGWRGWNRIGWRRRLRILYRAAPIPNALAAFGGNGSI